MKIKIVSWLFLTLTTVITVFGVEITNEQQNSKPNIIILLFDDVGYGDFGCYGHPIIKTPNMDKLAGQGARFTSFITAPGCVPSRTQLITGRYMARVNFGGSTGPGGEGGIPENEVTLAQGLKNAGYITGMVGKWHLGPKKQFLPTNKGFDEWYGTPYSNDFRKPWVQTDVPLGLYRGSEMVEHPINQNTITARYTEEAVNFINKNSKKNQPFFFYLAYNMAHLPIYSADEFRGNSKAGLYGDVMQELDWSVGRILKALQENNIEENTIVFLTSDNGPWMNPPDRMFLIEHNKPWHQGTAGLLRGSKGTTYEGGGRVPAMIRWPGKIPAGQVTCELIAMPDMYKTFMKIGNAELPNHTLDGYDILPLLAGETDKSPRQEYVYILRDLEALRIGDWKLRLATGEPELFNLLLDPSERYNRANEKHEIVHQIYKDMLQWADELNISISKSSLRIE